MEFFDKEFMVRYMELLNTNKLIAVTLHTEGFSKSDMEHEMRCSQLTISC